MMYFENKNFCHVKVSRSDSNKSADQDKTLSKFALIETP